MKRTTAKNLYLVLGILLLIGGIVFGLATLAFVMSPPGTYGADIEAVAGACAGIQLIPALILLYLWRVTSVKVREMDTLAAILRTVREVSVEDVAKQFHRTRQEAEILITQAVAEGHVQGYIDGREGKFVSAAWAGAAVPPPPPVGMPAPPFPAVPVLPTPTSSGTPEMRYCRECGSRVERIPGRNAWQCPSCGNIQ